MKWKIRKLSVLSQGTYQLSFETDEDTLLTVLCSVTEVAGKQNILFDTKGKQNLTFDSAPLRKAILSFNNARMVEYQTSAHQSRNLPAWFDPTPLILCEIEAVGEFDYELRFAEPNGDIKTIIERVVPMSCGDSAFLGINIIGEQEIRERIYSSDINALTVDFHQFNHSQTF